MFPLVEFCVSNMAKGGDYVYNKLEEDPEVDVLEYGCLQSCGICSSGLYALVDGEVVEGNTPDELLSNIYKHIEEQQEAWAMF
ncbi:YuzB family protein [Staphylococcus pettenkoferi]|uniref:YuzB family protein n=1 Tax=Staphylococcus pettenkoferi TaxID=170573 RepID=UPI002275ABFE|nr:YuzB family protein [Staphylococcus pettenkoferi]MCY1577088.1 YuzB family protein [Staphylococcus pettenkoferi]